MDAGSEVEYDMPGVLRLYKSGRVERFDGTDTVPPSPSGDPQPESPPRTSFSTKPQTSPPACTSHVAEPGKKFLVVVFFHGGAFMVHTIASPLYHVYADSLAAAVPVVVSVDYRSPRSTLSPLPTAYDDAFAALKAVASSCHPEGTEPWLAVHGDASRVVLGGDSTGANMAHNTAITPTRLPRVARD